MIKQLPHYATLRSPQDSIIRSTKTNNTDDTTKMTVVSARLESNAVENDSPSSHFVRLAFSNIDASSHSGPNPISPLLDDRGMDASPHTRVI